MLLALFLPSFSWDEEYVYLVWSSGSHLLWEKGQVNEGTSALNQDQPSSPSGPITKINKFSSLEATTGGSLSQAIKEKSLSDSISFAYLSSRLSISCQLYEFFIYWRGLPLSALQTLSQAVSCLFTFTLFFHANVPYFHIIRFFWSLIFLLVTVLVTEMCPQIQWYSSHQEVEFHCLSVECWLNFMIYF